MSRLVLLRHGQSEFNLAGRYAGWRDVALSPPGRRQALAAGRLMAAAGVGVDTAFVSWLGRALYTFWLARWGLGNPGLPYAATWRLNERHCGALEGLEKAAAEARFGKEAVEAWRRERDAPPPRLAPDDPRHPANDPRYAGVPAGELPAGESLGQVIDRLRPFWEADLRPRLGEGARVLVVGHGVCLWGLLSLLAGPGLPRFPLPAQDGEAPEDLAEMPVGRDSQKWLLAQGLKPGEIDSLREQGII